MEELTMKNQKNVIREIRGMAIIFVLCVVLWEGLGSPIISKAADMIVTGGRTKQSAVQLTEYNKSYANQITSANSDSWFYIITPNEDAYYNFYVKNVSLLPVTIGGHTQGAHVHLYSQLGEEIIQVYGIYENGENNESVKLEKNTKYYVNVHAGSSLSCESSSVGFIRLRIDCNKDNVSDSKDSSTQIGTDQIITNTLDGTGDDDWYSFNTGNKSIYRMYAKSMGLNPGSIGGHPYYVHMHLYSNLGESIATLYSNNVEMSGNIKLEQNTQYFIVLHSGMAAWVGCDGNGASIPVGKYSFSVFPKESLYKYCQHDYEQTIVQSSYTKKGYTLNVCRECGKKYKSNYTAKKKLAKGKISTFGGVISGKKRFSISYYRINDVSGYQIRYSTNPKFKKSVKVIKVGKNTTRKTVKKLKKGKKYYVQVRGYRKEHGKIVYGKWSKKRSAKVK